MSKVFNMVGGGGKNISSIIITGLKSTDTITCTKDGKSYIATWDETAQHWEIVGLPLGTFTVTATDGSNPKTETVLIDIAGVYEIEISLLTWLYKDGDECDGLTNGWTNNGYVRSGYTCYAGRKEKDCLNLGTTASYRHVMFGTDKKIDFSKSTKLCIQYTLNADNTWNPKLDVLTTKNYDSQYNILSVYGPSNFPAASSKNTVEFDITNYNGNYFIALATDEANVIAKIYRVWLK